MTILHSFPYVFSLNSLRAIKSKSRLTTKNGFPLTFLHAERSLMMWGDFQFFFFHLFLLVGG